mmetsp:Transcript_28269/g.64668  ORF Transcript_28269/g.64668 Transcript_28269/m.64668 type:complete len:184 (-) Transcript_28269:34-585(-)
MDRTDRKSTLVDFWHSQPGRNGAPLGRSETSLGKRETATAPDGQDHPEHLPRVQTLHSQRQAHEIGQRGVAPGDRRDGRSAASSAEGVAREEAGHDAGRTRQNREQDPVEIELSEAPQRKGGAASYPFEKQGDRDFHRQLDDLHAAGIYRLGSEFGGNGPDRIEKAGCCAVQNPFFHDDDNFG